MSKDTEKLREALKDNSLRGERFYSVMGTVMNVYGDGEFCTVMPLDESANLPNVRLTPDGEDEDFLIIPSEGSTVMVSFIDSTTSYVSMFSKVDSIKLKGDEFGGLIKIESLIDKLNAIESEINTIQEALVKPAANGTPPDAAATSRRLTETTIDDLENPNITHG